MRTFERPLASRRSAGARRVAPWVALLASVVATVAAGTASAGAAREPVPAVLGDAESSAEDIVDYALEGDRAKAVEEARALRSNVDGPAAAALRRAGASPAEISNLKLRAARVARLADHGSLVAVALGANAVSGLMPQLYAHFRNPVPPLVLRLDYLDREAQLRSLAGQRRDVAAAIIGLRKTWPEVRPKVIAAGGATAAAAYDRHVTAMRRLAPGARGAIQAEAVRGLQLVDELEQVFL